MVTGNYDKNRFSQLVDLLQVDPWWHMHSVSVIISYFSFPFKYFQISDGERRRVQLLLNLLIPFKLLLLDEVLADLDIVMRKKFLSFLEEV
jgi:CCR4-NOT complex subunit CAF16